MLESVSFLIVRVNTRYTWRQKLNNKETAATTTVMITKRPSLAIAAPAACYDGGHNRGCDTWTAYPSSVSTISTYHIDSSKGISPF